MKATFSWTAAALVAGLSASSAHAQYPHYAQPYSMPYRSPVFKTPLCVGPDACWGGFYVVLPNGASYGPNYYLRPPCPPFNGILPTVGQKVMADKLGIPCPNPNPNFPIPPAAFPYHPYVRSPRDFFMWRENMEDQLRREQRPGLVP